MSKPPILRLLLAVSLLVAGGSVLDAYLNLGDTFLGEICEPGEVDVLELDALEGTAISLKVLSTGTGSLMPRVVLTDLSDDAVLADETGGTRVIIEGLQLPATGRYRVEVSSADGSVGTYSVFTKGRNPPDLMKIVETQNVLGGESVEVTFDALAGFAFGGSIAAATAGPRFANPTLDGPHGPISLTGFTVQMPDLIRIDTLPLGLTALGSFTLKADNVGATGDVKTRVRLRDTLEGTTVEEEDDCN